MTHRKPFLSLLLRLLPLAFLLTACGQPEAPVGVKVGKPYSVNGTTYFPKYEPGYDKTGEASWYGPGFHGKHTASGEVFDQNDLTAAHPTLPMPSLVRVTNLSNGKSAVVRINDRGPFKSNRIIDLSKKSAQTIGISSIAKVRVQVLQEETQAYLAQLKNGGGKKLDMEKIEAAVAEKRQNDQIVEQTHANTTAGQTVNDAAPVMSVNSGELGGSDIPPPPRNPPRIHAAPAPAAHTEDTIAAADTHEHGTPLEPAGKPPESRYIRDELGQPVTSKRISEPEEMPAPEPANAALAEPAAGPSSLGGPLIQVGAFSQEENARKLNGSLSSIAAVSIAKIHAADKELWRVRLGPFASREAATQALARVHEAGIPDAHIVE